MFQFYQRIQGRRRLRGTPPLARSTKRPSFFAQNARDAPKILNAEYYFIWVETSKIHNSVNFYRTGPIFLHKVTDSEIYNFISKVEIGFCSDQYQFLLKNMTKLALEPKISLSEPKLQKFITNSLFIRLSRFSDRS